MVADFFGSLFETSDFPARWHCGNWSDLHGWVHVLSDIAIFGAYAAIPISIACFALTKAREVAFPKLYWLFAGFILSCGLTHLVEAVIFWHPWYRFSGLMKVLTATISWATVIALVRIMPQALQLPGITRLNQELKREIQERKAAGAALEESSTRLALALEHSQLGDWSWDSGSNLATLSRRTAEIFGLEPGRQYPREELRLHIHPEDRQAAIEAVERAKQLREPYDHEHRVIRPNDGREIWVHARGRALYDAAGQVTSLIGTLADVTERKHLDRERELLLTKERQARAEADEANRIKDEFLATLSHELRTPLNAILGWASLLRAGGSTPEELDTGLEVIERNTVLQTKLIGDLLDMSRILSGKIRLEVIRLNLAQLVQDSVRSLQTTAQDHGVQLRASTGDQPVWVQGDPARIEQIVWNLITNAIKFTPVGGWVEVSVLYGQDRAEVCVRDSGQGIAPEFLPHVFDRFRQGDASSTRQHGGLGLGLAIVKNLTEMHQGTVHVASDGVGQGATFRVTLPLDATSMRASAGELFPDASPQVRESADLSGTQIVVVDDAQDNLALMVKILSDRGAAVQAYDRAVPALDALRQGGVHVLISDLAMPEMDGFDLIAAVRTLDAEQGGHIPAVALTAFARPEDRDRALACGFDLFLTKPVDPAELVTAVCRGTGRGRHTPIHRKRSTPPL